MTSVKKTVWAFLILFGAAAAASAREIWVVQFRTQFPDAPQCQTILRWYSRLMLSNTTDLPLTVSLLGMSNGPALPNAGSLTVPPRQTTSVLGTLQVAPPHWAPDLPETSTAIWVLRLDVPTGVSVSDRGEVALNEVTNASLSPPCTIRGQTTAGLAFHVVDQLVPAGVSQYHLGVDIGNAWNAPGYDARINVGVFNASALDANALVEIRCSAEVGPQSGPDPLIRRLTIPVPPNAIVQQTVLASTKAAPCPIGQVSPYHVVVTSDQPGFSYAAAISNEALPKFTVFSPATD